MEVDEKQGVEFKRKDAEDAEKRKVIRGCFQNGSVGPLA